jgi:hypothetical protein
MSCEKHPADPQNQARKRTSALTLRSLGSPTTVFPHGSKAASASASASMVNEL